MLWKRGKAYSQDLRERVLASGDAGQPVGRIAARLQVSVSYVSKVLGRRAKTGETTARPQRCQMQPMLLDLHGAIGARVQACPDATLAELCAWLLATYEVSVSDTLMCKTLALLGLRLKKSPSGRRSRIGLMLPRPVLPGARSNPT